MTHGRVLQESNICEFGCLINRVSISIWVGQVVTNKQVDCVLGASYLSISAGQNGQLKLTQRVLLV
jgi:hypothetical protein